jgi:small conductance mechanosensitive channel
MSKLQLWNISSLVEKLVAKLLAWLDDFVVMLPNLVLAVVMVALGVIVSRRLQRPIERLLHRITGNEPISRLLGSLARIALIGLPVVVGLGLLHLDKTVTSVLAGVGVIGLALGFAFQDIAANFMSGFIMAIHRPFDVGDLVDIAGRMCRVQRIGLRATEVDTPDGVSILVPNKSVLENPISNYTRTRTRRMDLTMGAAYGDDMEKVRRTVLAAVMNIPFRDETREPELFFEEFGDSSINFQLRVWLTDSTQPAFLTARSEAMIAIKKAFDRDGITIPFPIRTLDFGASAVGGQPLDAMKLQVMSRG